MHLSEIKHRLLKFLRPPRQLRFTPEGTRFVIVALAIGVAAINTGNNLLYLILAMMLSMITLSGILSESSLRMVEIKRGLPKVAFAGKPFLVKITALNNKRRFPSISLIFQDHMDEKREAGSRYFLKIPPNGSESGNYHFRKEQGQVLQYHFQPAFFSCGKLGQPSQILHSYVNWLDRHETLLLPGIEGKPLMALPEFISVI